MAILGSGHVPDVQVTRKEHEPERELPELFFLDKNTELRHLFIALQHAGNHQTCGSMWGLERMVKPIEIEQSDNSQSRTTSVILANMNGGI